MALPALETRPLRLVAGAMLAAGAALTLLPGNPGLACPLRTFTGIPCPLCGMTTSVVSTMRFRVGDALVANPGGVLLVVLALVLLVARPARVPLPPAWVLFTGLALSWVWQLQRFSVV